MPESSKSWDGARTKVIAGGVLITACAVALAVIFLFKPHPLERAPERATLPALATSTLEVANMRLTLPLIRRVAVPDLQSVWIEIYAVRTITDGIYKGDTLAFMVEKSVLDASHPEEFTIYEYGYFISTDTGIPLAWDDASFVSCGDLGPCNPFAPAKSAAQAMGLTEDLKVASIGIPNEFQLGKIFATQKRRVNFLVGEGSPFAATTTDPSIAYYHWSPYAYQEAEVVDYTPEGYPVIRVPYRPGEYSEAGPGSLLAKLISPEFDYDMMLPTGRTEIVMRPDFLATTSAVSVRWDDGKAPARYGGGYNDGKCFSSLGNTILTDALIRTGATAAGQAVYEIDPVRYPDIYVCLNAINHMTWDEGTYGFEHTYTQDEFNHMHPLFFWQSPYGEWLGYIRTDVYQQGPHD